MIRTFQHLALLALLSIGTSCFAQVYTPTVTVDSLLIEIKEDTTKVQRLEEAQKVQDSLRNDSLAMLGKERLFLIQLRQEINQSDSALREPMLRFVDGLIRRIDNKIEALQHQINWKTAYDIAVILPFRSDVMPKALEQWKLEMEKVIPNAAKLAMPKSLFQNYDLYDGIMSYLTHRSDSSIQLNLSVWDNYNSVDSNQAILNSLQQDPPDFIIGPGFGGKSNAMLSSTLSFANEYGSVLFDPGCTKLDTSMLHGHYIGYQPNYLETFYSSLDLASKQDSSAYILVFQPDSNPQYNKLLAEMKGAVVAYNKENNTTMTPVVYGRLQDEFEDALEDEEKYIEVLRTKCLFDDRKTFIHFPTNTDQLIVRFYELLSPVIQDTSSATAVGLEGWLETRQLEYHKVLNTNLVIPSYTRKNMTCLPDASIYEVRQATNLNPSESFKLGYEIMMTINLGVQHGGQDFLANAEDSLIINFCDSTQSSIDYVKTPFFGGYQSVKEPGYWQSYGIQWMKLEGIEAVPFKENEE